MSLRLEIEEGGSRRAVDFDGPEITIGRGADNQVVVNDPRSSRHHCRIVKTPQGVLLEDRNSRNGTILNGSATKKSFVKPGDRFLVGNVRFVLREGEREGIVPAAAPAVPASDETPLESEIDGIESDELLLAPDQIASTVAGRAPPPPRRVRDADEERSAVAEQAGQEVPGHDERFPDGVYLETLQGERPGERFGVRTSPFVIGRGAQSDLPLKDPRASSRHARIVREGSAFYVEDMGSRNGTALNKRPVKRALLTPDSVLLVGNSSFRVHVPAPDREVAVEASGGEELVRFDVERFLERGRAEHPLAVAAVVIIVGIVCYFTIDVTLRLAVPRPIDAPAPSNLIARNWSFEEVAGESSQPPGEAGKVPGWRPGDEGALLAIDTSHAQIPGTRALRLTAPPGSEICRATHEMEVAIGSDRHYRLEGYTSNESSFAAGLMVEWLRASGSSYTPAARTYSETARQPGETVDVNQEVVAPPLVSRALVSCFVLGGGSAYFDRISFSSAAGDQGGDEATEAGVAVGPEGEALAALPRSFEAGPKENPLLVTATRDGAFEIDRRRKQVVPGLWAGLLPDRDPQSFGPRISSPRIVPGNAGGLDFLSEIPDVKERRWVTVEATAIVNGEELLLRWRTSGGADSGEKAPLGFYLETREGGPAIQIHLEEPAVEKPSADSAVAEPKDDDSGESSGAQDVADGSPVPVSTEPGTGMVREVVVGEGDERVAISFAAPLKFSSRPHPLDPSRTLWVGEGSPAAIEVAVSHASRFEVAALKADFQRAEEEFRAGRVGSAVAALLKVKSAYPEEKAEVQRAADRIAEWRKQAADDLARAEAQAAELRVSPAPVVRDMMLRRLALLADRYKGLDEATQAEKLAAEVRAVWTDGAAARDKEELKALHAEGMRLFSGNHYFQAELYLRWVAEGDPEGDLGREAARTLKVIDGRRERDLQVRLRR